MPVPTVLDDVTPSALRPVLAPLPALTEAGDRLLTAASQLFYDRGVRAVGVDLIADTAGTTKKTLYDRFGSKDALVALYLLRRAHRWREHLAARLTEGGRHPVLTVFTALETWMGTQHRGCAFVNAYAELGGGPGAQDHPAVAVVRSEKAWMRALFDDLTGEAELGGRVHLVYEGALVLRTAGGDPDAIAAGRDAAAALLAGRSDPPQRLSPA
ncbi:TetR/AcrR family transcriptional regulator [Kineococcus endophyticus]|uniref:TetR/AcrR family transcriptional regulator n=1 Tax=Kineococcus endophyticus TaxID=1181883 RepID=A0ABV3PDD5_9ACTN